MDHWYGINVWISERIKCKTPDQIICYSGSFPQTHFFCWKPIMVLVCHSEMQDCIQNCSLPYCRLDVFLSNSFHKPCHVWTEIQTSPSNTKSTCSIINDAHLLKYLSILTIYINGILFLRFATLINFYVTIVNISL